MRVVAIDPAPGSKGSTMYSSEEGFRQIPGEKMRRVLDAERETGPVLLCWDAPLTGPRDPENANQPGDFIQRRLDKFFRLEATGFRTPPGISVLPYASCWHWTLTRSVLGLPRVGPFDAKSDLPFRLLPDESAVSEGARVAQSDRPCIVEIHPAVAAWLWCKDLPEFESRSSKGGKGWKYKGSKRDRTLQNKMWEVVLRHCDGTLKASLPKSKPDGESWTPSNDDEFDAIIGYILGVKWLRGEDDKIVLLGDRENGSMLLPRTAGLCKAWEEFRDAAGS